MIRHSTKFNKTFSITIGLGQCFWNDKKIIYILAIGSKFFFINFPNSQKFLTHVLCTHFLHPHESASKWFATWSRNWRRLGARELHVDIVLTMSLTFSLPSSPFFSLTLPFFITFSFFFVGSSLETLEQLARKKIVFSLA